MGLHFTRYGQGINGGEIQFNVDKFTYSFTDDPFKTETADDFDNILLEQGDVFNVIRQSQTTDSMGNPQTVTDDTFRIYAIIQDIDKKNRVLHEMGIAAEGTRTMYVKPSYTITSGGTDTTYIVKEGDVLLDRNDYRWRVIKIENEHYINGVEIFKKCIIQSIGLEGSY